MLDPFRSIPRTARSISASQRSLLASSVFVALLESSTGCSPTQRGATDQHARHAAAEAPEGAAVFASYCADCHGARGEGTLQHPPLMGQSALPGLASAAELHSYVEAHMPQLGKEELSAPDYWAVVTFVVMANGLPVPEGGLDSDNAASIALH